MDKGRFARQFARRRPVDGIDSTLIAHDSTALDTYDALENDASEHGDVVITSYTTAAFSEQVPAKPWRSSKSS